MKVLKEQIRSIVITRIPFAIINSKGKMKYPFISSSASEQVVNALVNGIYEELSKLDQPTVISRRELLLDFAEYSENDNTSTTLDGCVDDYLYSLKQ